MLAAGVLFATSAGASGGTDLRSGRRVQLSQLIAERDAEVRAAEERAARLRSAVDQGTRARSRQDGRVTEAQAAADALARPVGLTAVRGPAVTVRLDDATLGPGGELPDGATVDDVVVHQQDVQAVVNALWAGGAEAMTIMGERVIATGAVRCVGNTLLLYGRRYSPPFVVTAIGPVDRMRASLAADPGVRAFRQAARDFGVGYSVEQAPDVRLPGYRGQVSLPLTQEGPR